MKEKVNVVNKNVGGGGGAVYGLGLLGAVIYYFGQANTFWEFVIGFLKAIVWPAFIIFEFHEYFQLPI